jgi:hypothetical protein
MLIPIYQTTQHHIQDYCNLNFSKIAHTEVGINKMQILLSSTFIWNHICCMFEEVQRKCRFLLVL